MSFMEQSHTNWGACQVREGTQTAWPSAHSSPLTSQLRRRRRFTHTLAAAHCSRELLLHGGRLNHPLSLSFSLSARASGVAAGERASSLQQTDHYIAALSNSTCSSSSIEAALIAQRAPPPFDRTARLSVRHFCVVDRAQQPPHTVSRPT